MSGRPSRLFARLRRHRGVWVLALAVLLFKVAMSTFCVLDGPRVAFGGDTAGAVAVEDGDYCVLGEASGCHCTCAHAVALPSVGTTIPVAVTILPVDVALIDPLSPAFIRSPLRPPIA